ncbi:MAG: adenylate kinase family protein [Alphaproteobacteria bacterium]
MIVMMGGPGVGKGTFSRMLMDTHTYEHIEAGAILRAEPADSEIRKIISTGNLVPDKLVCDLMVPLLTGKNDIIMDGFPRTTSQAKWLVQNYANKYNIHILYLNTDEQTLVFRIQKRIREGTKRADDATIEIIKHRLENFRRITLPAIEWLRTAPGIKFSEINAAGATSDNFAEIMTALSK